MQRGIAYEPGAREKVVGRKLAILPADLASIAWDHAADHVGNDLDIFAGKCPTEDVIALLSVLPTRYAFEKLSPEGHSANAAIAGTVWASKSLRMLSKTETAARRLFAEIYRATVDRPMRYCGLQETAQRAKADADAVIYMLATSTGLSYRRVRPSLGASHPGRQKPREMTLDDAIAALYVREINRGCETFWDGGIEVCIGDAMNGHHVETMFSRENMGRAGSGCSTRPGGSTARRWNCW
jgi:hypothetical protein